MSKQISSLDGLKKIVSNNISKINIILFFVMIIAVMGLTHEWYKVNNCYLKLSIIKTEYKSYLDSLKSIIDGQGDEELDDIEKKNTFGLIEIQ